MFGWIGKIKSGFQLVGKLRRLVDEGRDLEQVYQTFEQRYGDLDEDLKYAWKELREFLDALRAVVK